MYIKQQGRFTQSDINTEIQIYILNIDFLHIMDIMSTTRTFAVTLLLLLLCIYVDTLFMILIFLLINNVINAQYLLFTYSLKY